MPLVSHSVFHAKLHFSSSRATFWHLHDPCNYRLHDIEDCINPDVCLAYPTQAYPLEAKVDEADIRAVLYYVKVLRGADENIYLFGLTQYHECHGGTDLLMRWFPLHAGQGIPATGSVLLV